MILNVTDKLQEGLLQLDLQLHLQLELELEAKLEGLFLPCKKCNRVQIIHRDLEILNYDWLINNKTRSPKGLRVDSP